MKVPRSVLLGLLSLLLVIASHSPAAAKDEWLEVRSKNFYLIGNASDKDIRKVARKLEEFRETFRLLFNTVSLASPVPTHVIVFKSDDNFKPFKPKRADGKADTGIAGYFQRGEDVNYIAVSASGSDEEFGTIYHEYVHFIVNSNFGKSEVPPWFNEGLAEYYSTFQVVDDQTIKLGLADSNHLFLLQQSKLMPLEQLFKVSNRQLHAQGGHSRSIFYAESWALIHYLILGNKGPGLDKFLAAVLKGTPQDKAFKDAFQMDYTQMEAELQKYVNKSSYQYLNITLKNKLNFEADMVTAPYSDADMNFRLGDLLYHTNRNEDAEPYLLAALKLNPDMSPANTTMGMVKLEQRKFDEARQYLEKATAGDQKNHLAFYRYAYLLSREGRDDLGFVREIPKETADKARTALKKAIALAPNFGESYDLLAFLSLVSNDGIDEALALMQKASRMQPGNERYAMRLAELYLKKGRLDEALAMTAKFAQSDDDELRRRAESLASEINDRKQMASMQQRRDAITSTDSSTGPVLKKRGTEKQLSEEEIKKLEQEALLKSINEALRPPEAGETRVIGHIQKIECRGSAISYQVKTTDGAITTLSSKNFQGLTVTTFSADADNVAIGCSRDLSALNAVVTFKEGAPKGELVAVEFVPASFRFLSKEEVAKKDPVVFTNSKGEQGFITTSTNDASQMEKMRRDMVMQSLKDTIRQPGAGEKRDLGYLEKIDCSGRRVFFNFKTATGTLKLLDLNPESLPIRVFTPDLSGMQFGCGTSVMDIPAVIVYTNKPDSKLKTAGEIVAIDFVPKSFKLE